MLPTARFVTSPLADAQTTRPLRLIVQYLGLLAASTVFVAVSFNTLFDPRTASVCADNSSTYDDAPVDSHQQGITMLMALGRQCPML